MSPDGSKSVPPEEKLLRLIRGTPQPATHSTPELASASAPSVLPRTRLVRWRFPSWAAKGVVLLLVGVIMAELIMMARVVITPEPPVDLAALPDAPAIPAAPLSPEGVQSALATSAARPLFQSATPQPASLSPAAVAPSASASALLERLSLLGIVSGERPQAIIEDTQTHKTYFVTVGQHVIEGLIVEAVDGNRVVLTLQGERVELSL